MGFSGDLEDLPLHDILNVLSRHAKSGLLSLTTRTDEITLVFDRGTVASVTTTDGSLRIGQLLVDQGFVTDEQLEQALALQAVSSDSARIGDVLTEVGYVTPEQIQVAVAAQLEASLFRILVQSGGTFEFTAESTVQSEPIMSGIQLEPMVLNAMRLADEWLANHEPNQILVLSDELIDPSIFEYLSEHEHETLVQLLNGHATMHALVRRTGLSTSEFKYAVERLVERGLVRVEFVPEREEQPAEQSATT